MNIFILEVNPQVAAQMLMDKHVVKMALETAQILSTVSGGPYKPTHKNHPCVLWAGSFSENYAWLVEHGIGICNEYEYRYGKEHKCQEVIYKLRNPPNTLTKGLSPFVQCMPDDYKKELAVDAYRAYYHSKRSFATWTKRNKPYWWKVQDVQSIRTTSIDPRTIVI
jgi:hypothetical protein